MSIMPTYYLLALYALIPLGAIVLGLLIIVLGRRHVSRKYVGK